MSNTPVYGLRLPDYLRSLIDARRGELTLSAWIREACARRLEADEGLGPEVRAELRQLGRQLIGIATNLNQMARAANEGRPVEMPREDVREILREIIELRRLLGELLPRLLL